MREEKELIVEVNKKVKRAGASPSPTRIE